MFCWNCIRLRKNRKNLTLFYFKRHYVRELQYCFTNLLLSKRKYRFTFCENITTAWCRSSPLLLFSFTIFFRWVCLSLCFVFVLFLCLFIFIYTGQKLLTFQFLNRSLFEVLLSVVSLGFLWSNLDYPNPLGLDEIVRIIKNMNINEEQKLIKLRKGHLIVKQNIYKSFWGKIWSTSSLPVVNTSTSEKCYIGLKCRSQSGCPKEEYRVWIESSIILRSCIIRIASTLFCLSFQNKHFLKHSIASEFEKILLSWPSSA